MGAIKDAMLGQVETLVCNLDLDPDMVLQEGVLGTITAEDACHRLVMAYRGPVWDAAADITENVYIRAAHMCESVPVALLNEMLYRERLWASPNIAGE